jgi:hypothetical protein
MQPAQPTVVQPGRPNAGPFAPVRSDSAEVVGDDAQVDAIVRRLQRRYPQNRISPAELESRVRGFYRQFEPARITTFVGVFVERLIRRSIEQPSLDAPPTSAGRTTLP